MRSKGIKGFIVTDGISIRKNKEHLVCVSVDAYGNFEEVFITSYGGKLLDSIITTGVSETDVYDRILDILIEKGLVTDIGNLKI